MVYKTLKKDAIQHFTRVRDPASLEALTQIHSNQIFEYRVAISMGALLERPPSPDSEGKTGELDNLYFHPSSNNASLFWLEDDRQSNYRSIRKNSDLEGVNNFLRDKEWTSRRVDTSWSLVEKTRNENFQGLPNLLQQ